MIIQKFFIIQYSIENIFYLIEMNEIITMPKIKKLFIWNSVKVRDFIDSLYKGYPVGSIIWQTCYVKDDLSSRKKIILIDGYQRIMALVSSLLGKEIFDSNYRKIKIQIAFNPIDEIFEVSNSVIQKDKKWISDISEFFSSGFNIFKRAKDYYAKNKEISLETIFERFNSLKKILNIPIEVINLSDELGSDEIKKIFIRINS